MVDYSWGQRGGPWEFNLRDLFRWCDLMTHDQTGQVKGHAWNPGQHVGLIYRERLRLSRDREKVLTEEENKEEFQIDDVTCDVVPGSIHTHHSTINCSFARQFSRTSCLVRACAFKTPAT